MLQFIRKYGYDIGIIVSILCIAYCAMKLNRRYKTPPTITIWIHGTGPNGVLPQSIANFARKHARPFIYCKKGLHPAQSLPEHYHHRKIADTLCKNDPHLFSKKWFYLFGWSGELDHNVRKKEAEQLFKELKKVTWLYKAMYGCKPKIRIITHSHGGNVALNLAHIQGKASMPITIDELVLLACPVQKTTVNCIKHPMFKNIYSIHSHFDFIQIADPQGWPAYKETIQNMFKASSFDEAIKLLNQLEGKSLLSDRHFPARNNITQVRYKSKYRDLMHIEFILLPFIKQLPAVIKQMHRYNNKDTHHDEVLINAHS